MRKFHRIKETGELRWWGQMVSMLL